MNNEQSSAVVDSERRVKPRSRRRSIWIALAIALVLAIGLAVWAAMDALTVRGELVKAAKSVEGAKTAATAGDVDRAGKLVTQAQEDAARARKAMANPVLGVAKILPTVGVNLKAVDEVTHAVYDLTHQAMPGLLNALDVLHSGNLVSNGSVDLARLLSIAEPVTTAHVTIGQINSRIAAIERDGLMDAVAGPVDDLEEELAGITPDVRTAYKAVRVLPDMLGASGERTYLLLLQNNAEARSLGGIVGSYAQLDVSDGAITIGVQSSAVDFPEFDDAVVELSEDEEMVFGPLFALYAPNPTMHADFGRSAETARAMWKARTGTTVDGVIATDPVALAALLGVTGPVAVEGTDVTLTKDNAVQVLLSDAYTLFDSNAAQDAFFEQAAMSVFTAVLRADGGPALVNTLAEIARDNRLLVWSANEAEDETLAGTVLSGDLVGRSGDSPVVGVYLNESMSSKMSYYLERESRLAATSCSPADGSSVLSLDLTLRSTAPGGGVGLPDYVTGWSDGTQMYNVTLFGPDGSAITEISIDGKVLTEEDYEVYQYGLQTASTIEIELTPGQELKIHADMTTGPGLGGVPILRQTPGPFESPVSIVADHVDSGKGACSNGS